MNGINNIRDNFSHIPLQDSNSSVPVTKDMGFSDRLKKALKEVNNLQVVGDASSEDVIKDKLGIHEGMMALQEADMSLRLMLQVRSKVIEAYKEVMRMPG
ncbi:MAG: flagellar hook-basal body complex protein FliE [Desulfobacterales bacterium]|nr:flagellar hook-basal body complex protein FliE [Desulfobacterales bacterium]